MNSEAAENVTTLLLFSQTYWLVFVPVIQPRNKFFSFSSYDHVLAVKLEEVKYLINGFNKNITDCKE